MASRRWRCSSAARSRAAISASSAAPTSRSRRQSALFDGVWAGRQALSGVDEPRRPRHAAARRLHGHGDERERAVRGRRRREARASTASMFHPEVVHTPRRRQAARATSCTRSPACKPTGRWRTSARAEVAKIRAQVGKGARHLRAVGRRRLCRRRGADPRSDRRPAHLHLRRPRPDAAGRGRGGRAPVPRPLQHPARARRCARALPRRARRRRDPEAKRKTIGALFIDVFEEEAKKLGGADFLAQGTLYPDVIESVSFTGGPSVTIKSHHNVGGLPERMNLKLVEPLRELFKDEVRALGRELGLPEHFVGRHPFPGPGLAIRIPGEITRREARRSCARRTPSISTRSARPASTTRSGRRLPCCCRCGPSASWATGAPTITSARCAPSPRPTA